MNKRIAHTKPFPTLHNIHVADESVITDFLVKHGKDIGSINYLGSFIDNLKIENDIGINAILTFRLVEREQEERESPGEKYHYNENGNKDIFEESFDLPDIFPEKPMATRFVLRSTVKTYSCEPKQRCPKCHGSGNCLNCDTRGYYRCSSCEGTGKRQTSVTLPNGNRSYKTISCYSCQGSGRRTCQTCNGSGRCLKCRGSGEITCTRCEGTGSYQTYVSYSHTIDTVITDFHYTEDKELTHIISETKNKIVFDDDLIEWENKDTILFDKRQLAINQNKHAKEFIGSFEELAGLKVNQKFGRIHAKFETVPITTISYSFEDKDYSLSIVGEDNIVCFNDIPKKHNYRVSFFRRILNWFYKKKRKIAFVYIASYILHANGSIDESDLKLLDLFLNGINLNPSKRAVLVDSIGRQLTIEDIMPHIKCVQTDLRALVFAWQCVLQREKINDKEIIAFNELVTRFRVKNIELDKIKHKAAQFQHLKEEQMLEEYFK